VAVAAVVVEAAAKAVAAEVEAVADDRRRSEEAVRREAVRQLVCRPAVRRVRACREAAVLPVPRDGRPESFAAVPVPAAADGPAFRAEDGTSRRIGSAVACRRHRRPDRGSMVTIAAATTA
jgi:hypothetical protein